MRKSKPYTEMDNLVKPRVGKVNSVSRRALIAAKAQGDPKAQFSNLMHHLNFDLVKESLSKIPKNSAPGVDGMTVKQAMGNLDWLLPPQLAQIHRGQYYNAPRNLDH